MKSLLSSPMTANRAPVGTLFNNLPGSSRSGRPDAVVLCPFPRETEPLPVIRIRWPFLTTKPEFVQPLEVLSARTFTPRAIGADVFELVFTGGRVVGTVLAT